MTVRDSPLARTGVAPDSRRSAATGGDRIRIAVPTDRDPASLGALLCRDRCDDVRGDPFPVPRSLL